MKSKRGTTDVLPWILIELVLAVFVGVSFFAIGNAFGSGEVFDKVLLANDHVFSIQTLSSLPYLSQVELGNNSNYNIKIENNQVEVYRQSQDLTAAIRSFSASNNLVVDYKTPEHLFLTNTGYLILSTEDTEISTLRCPSIDSSTPSSITLVPETIFGEPFIITDTLQAQIGVLTLVEKTNLLNQPVLFVIETKASKNPKISFTPNLRSRKLACLIAKELFPGSSLSIYPSDKGVLSQSEIGVSIELLEEKLTIDSAISIANAVREYTK